MLSLDIILLFYCFIASVMELLTRFAKLGTNHLDDANLVGGGEEKKKVRNSQDNTKVFFLHPHQSFPHSLDNLKSWTGKHTHTHNTYTHTTHTHIHTLIHTHTHHASTTLGRSSPVHPTHHTLHTHTRTHHFTPSLFSQCHPSAATMRCSSNGWRS